MGSHSRVLGIVVFYCVMIGFIASAAAVPITVSFNAVGFTCFGPGSSCNTPPSADPVVGSIMYDAISTISDINSLVSVELTIGNHNYLVSEVGFLDNHLFDQRIIGGLISGVSGISSGTDDFRLQWSETTLMPEYFSYATSSSSGIYSETNFTQFTITQASAVAEPSGLPVLVIGAAGIMIAARRRWFFHT
jgi:hypothetical protein